MADPILRPYSWKQRHRENGWNREFGFDLRECS